jgi:hypothetical protein
MCAGEHAGAPEHEGRDHQRQWDRGQRDERRAKVQQKEKQHDQDENRAHHERLTHVEDAAVDEVLEPEELRVDDDIGRQGLLHLAKRLGDPLRKSPRVHVGLLGDGEHDTRHAVDGAVATFELRALDDLGHLSEQDRPLGVNGDRHPAEILDHAGRVWAEPTEHPDRPLLLPLHGEAAAGVDVAVAERLLDHLQRHAILEHRRRIGEDLVLLAVATLHEDLGHAGNLEEPWPHDPVGRRPQAHRLFQLRGEHHVAVTAGDGERE